MRAWTDGPKFCNLIEDDLLVVGQCVLTAGGWMTYDNTRVNTNGTTALPLGLFRTLEEAKATVERETSNE